MKKETVFNIGIVVLIIIILGAVAVPSFLKARCSCLNNSCINTMRLIDGAKEQWAMAANQTNGDTVDTAACNDYIKLKTTPTCPHGGTYTYNPIGSDPECSLNNENTGPVKTRCKYIPFRVHHTMHVFRG